MRGMKLSNEILDVPKLEKKWTANRSDQAKDYRENKKSNDDLLRLEYIQ